MIKTIIVFLIPTLIGCQFAPPYHTTTKSAIIFDNRLNVSITIKDISRSEIAPEFRVNSNEIVYAYTYEAPSKNTAIPKWLTQLSFESEQCSVNIDRDNLEKLMVKNKEGRAGWDLIIDNLFLVSIGCKT